MKEIGNIYLSWRKGPGQIRHIVGLIRSSANDGIRFAYNKKAVEEAMKEGFAPYTEFPDINKEYKENVIEIFGQRIIKSERSDIKDFYSFWEINERHKEDKYYMLAHTQGMLPTDNFEFLADFHPVKELSFLTDIAGLTILQLPLDTVKKGDELIFKYDPQNSYDNKAVKVFKASQHIGYIKKVHCWVFHKKNGDKLKLKVKAVDQNGVIKRIFVKVSF